MRKERISTKPPADAEHKAYFTEFELAEYLAVSVKWLRKKRLEGGGIPYHKFGNSVRYAFTRVREFEAMCERGSTSDSGEK